MVKKIWDILKKVRWGFLLVWLGLLTFSIGTWILIIKLVLKVF